MAKYSSFGTLLQIGDGQAPETFTTIGNVMDQDGPDEETDFEETTTHSSAAAGNYKEWDPLMQDGGELKTEILWDPNDVTHQRLQLAKTTRLKLNCRTVYPTSPVKTASFSGYVKSFPFKAPVKGMLKRGLTIKITGSVTGL